jgi:hypothetical protein
MHYACFERAPFGRRRIQEMAMMVWRFVGFSAAVALSAMPTAADDTPKPQGNFTVILEQMGSSWLVISPAGNVRYCKLTDNKLQCSNWSDAASQTVNAGASGAGPSGAVAKISVTCGGKTYEISTGNIEGNCSTSAGQSDGGGLCTDGKGNTGAVSCNKNGSGACTASGSGSCTEQH